MPNFHEFLKFQDHSIIQLKMAIFADLKQNILKTAQNIALIFGIKWKHDKRNTITKLYCPKRSGSFKNEGGSFKNLNFFKKKIFFKNFIFSIWAILSWKKGKKRWKFFFLTNVVWHLVIFGQKTRILDFDKFWRFWRFLMIMAIFFTSMKFVKLVKMIWSFTFFRFFRYLGFLRF